MLETLASILRIGIEPLFGTLLLQIYIAKQHQGKYSKSMILGISLGVLSSICLFLINKLWVRLEFVDVWEKGSLLAMVILLGSSLIRNIKQGNRNQILLFFFCYSYMMNHGEQILSTIIPKLVLDNGFSTEWMLKCSALLIGTILLIILWQALQGVGSKLYSNQLRLFLGIYVLSLLVHELVDWLQLMIGLRIIPLSMLIFHLLTPFVNNKNLFFYILVALLSLFIISVIVKALHEIQRNNEHSTNPALYRKNVAYKRNLRLSLFNLSLTTFMILSMILGQQVISAKALETKPPTKVQAEDGHIHIQTADLKEKELNVYRFKTKDNIEVPFLVVRKMGENFGVALDACEICGVAGYYEKDGQILCKKCQSVVNMTTIGFKGGCNPIPLHFENDKGMLTISSSDLEKIQNKFQ
ncbi:MAG TPA: Fe-S-containing protein [Bacillota bacterium]|nr:Fe-S-containing protein [Bacillota bacterium]